MQRLFTHGLRGEPLKDTEIGPMPESWTVASLGDFGRIGNGSTPKKTNPVYWQSPITPWLTSAKVHEGIISSADQRSEEHTSELQSLMRISYAVFCLKKKTKRTKMSKVNYINIQLNHIIQK